MTFAGINYLAVLIAAVVAWLGGAVWYSLFGKAWVHAQDKTMEQFKAEQAPDKGTPRAFLPFFIAFLAELVMAWVLAGIVGHISKVSIYSAIVTGLFVWAGFIVAAMVVNNAFTGRQVMLTVIDAAHWLLVILLMAVVIGWIGL